ncbi:hypothetical protein HOLleu_18889 [Holothuria leucospilota]|uniref:Uncharacterized protein n=1 Tax=Holothuria leucospilota TaxID=206669 RepID=A0A9Q1C3Y8_HOLLE|nr:hypothetical protein HOLleu_18889 [Holothuria leucospilota]
MQQGTKESLLLLRFRNCHFSQPQNNTQAQQPQTTPKQSPTRQPYAQRLLHARGRHHARRQHYAQRQHCAMATLRPKATALKKHWANTGAPCPRMPGGSCGKWSRSRLAE